MFKRVTQKISIECKYLDSDINKHILQKIQNKFSGQWTFDNGYILNVTQLIHVGDNFINPATSLAMFDVVYEIETLKPKKDLILDGNVCMVLGQGLFVDIRGLMNVLVPAKTMKNYVFSNNNSFKNTKNNKEISKNDKVQIKLTNVQYSDKKYICIGILTETSLKD